MKGDVTVSVIIPAYNAEQYMAVCLDSVLAQTYPAFEILVVNDGSTDGTEAILAAYAREHDCIQYFTQANQGQGYSRNRALQAVSGTHILFLDSDDLLEPFTLEKCRADVLRGNPDFVQFEYKYLEEKSGKIRYTYLNRRLAWRKSLRGEQCRLLLTNAYYYSCTGLYQKDFLLRNDICFGQGYIYEDHLFYAHCCLCAKHVTLIHTPFYLYRKHSGATTKKDLQSEKHAQGLLRATEDSLALCNRLAASEFARAQILNHKWNRFVHCYRHKTPRHYRPEFMRRFLELLAPVLLREEQTLTPLFRLIYRKQYLYRKQEKAIRLLLLCQKNRAKLRSFGKKLRGRLRLLRDWRTAWYRVRYVKDRTSPDAMQGVLFLGFDFESKGNTLYLYRDLQKRKPEIPLYFVTKKGENGNIKQGSAQYYRLLAKAKVIIAESWLPAYLQKKPGQTLLQTWHATTIKKLLFDTAEPETVKKNYRQKIKKYADTQNWDYFITENEAIKPHYQSCFHLKAEQLVAAGYPRVDYLLRHKNDSVYRINLRKKFGIEQGKKTVLYAPTWRDYNYGKKKNYDYLPDFEVLCSCLGEDYLLLFKEHDFLQRMQETRGRFLDMNAAEVQDLLLVSDFVISDYSSIVFDAMAIDIPVLLYANDRAAYEKVRGVYEDVFADLCNWSCKNEKELSEKIKSYRIDAHYQAVKKKYCQKEGAYFLTEFVTGLIKD